ncbi:hypothetical protein M0802_004495 [Mischocyttarus mexicanus]|nr:hypothetical protein M0802_014342 [Mischocyttarus mexicanus]KAI4500533.1 hypothetical protein M0802_004495 [Mischocyttarus mexicanus]
MSDGVIFRTYFTYVFPIEDLCKWLSYKKEANLQLREFSITLVKGIFIRYLTFQHFNKFREIILKEKPAVINIGAIYNVPPKRTASNKIFVERELIFDIDISDYNDVRTCCQQKEICKRCWKYIVIACKILYMFLKDSFGFNKILWVFSGRRGIHCWVCDKDARKLDYEVRHSIIGFMRRNILKCALKDSQYVLRELNYCDRRMLSIIEPEFVPLCIVDQNLLGTKEGMSSFLGLLPIEALKDVERIFNENTTSLDRWNEFISYYKLEIDSKVKHWINLTEYLDHVKLHYCCPRFDENVTREETHLLRCPFSIHFNTKKIALPFDITQIEEFDPTTSFTIDQVVKEVNTIYKNMSSNILKNVKIDYNKTSLKYPLIIFRKFLEQISEEN